MGLPAIHADIPASSACFPPYPNISIDKLNIVQMGKLNNSIDVRQKPTLNGTLNGTSLKYLNMV